MIDLGFEEEIRNTLDHYRGRFGVGKTCFFFKGIGSSDLLWPGNGCQCNKAAVMSRLQFRLFKRHFIDYSICT